MSNFRSIFFFFPLRIDGVATRVMEGWRCRKPFLSVESSVKSEHPARQQMLICLKPCCRSHTLTQTHIQTGQNSSSISFTEAMLTGWTWPAANRQRMGLGGPTQTGGWHQLEGRQPGKGGRYGLRQRDLSWQREWDIVMWRPHRLGQVFGESVIKQKWERR